MTEAAFLQRILDDLASAAATWLVFADWLEERGDRRHELLRFRHDPRYRSDLSAAERDEQVCTLLRAGVKPPLPTVTNCLGMRFVLVSPGTFLMGSPETEKGRSDWEGPRHEVEITRPFLLGVHPVTQEEYERVMECNPSHFGPTGQGAGKVKKIDTRRLPVECVSWEDAVAFCQALSEVAAEKAAGRSYRLPTEAEWEYACRGGAFFKDTSAPFYLAEPAFVLDATLANFNGNPFGGGKKDRSLGGPTPVESYPANSLGLHDMHGNVWEWCADWYDAHYYSRSERQDPQGPPSGSDRVLRGGSWLNVGRGCRAAYRNHSTPDYRNVGIGFRVLLCAAPGLVSA
jgi:uncharacterized protein (TIGR02996 family)